VALGNQETHSPIVNAIRNAEEFCSGQIRVHLSKKWLEKDTSHRAQELFDHYKMANSSTRSSVLIYANLRNRRFSILGDTGIHQAVGPLYWTKIAQELAENLRSTQSERALALIVTLIGQALKKYFPSERS
jgi:uncharacterized membrane protein